ncbi:MAG TPA: PAS domain S-box protein [Bryobacteraceae bacterium]|nr:PAS domain S-box protein [Bryobacteraceae bacterium]
MLSRESAQVAETAELASRNIQSKITSSVSTYIAPLEALVARWGADADAWQPEWESEAAQLRQRYPALESVHWVDSSYTTRWGVPSKQLQSGTLRQEMNGARDAGKTLVVPSAGNKSLLILIPISRHSNFTGCVIATLATEQWLHATIDPEVPKGYTAMLLHGDEQLYMRHASSVPNVSRYLSEASVNFYGLPLVVRVWPTPDEWAEPRNVLLALSLVIGLLIYASGALAVVAHRRARTVEWAKLQMAEQQEHLREANQWLQTVIEAAPFAIVAVDPAGIVRSWNTAAESMFGWTSAEVAGRIPPFVTNEQREEFHNKIERASRGELLSRLERRRQRKDGGVIDVAIWAAPLRDAMGSTISVILAITDISEHKKLEEQLRHSQKMEAVGRLAGGVAHDFNNLLTIINGYGHMMLSTLNPQDRLRSHAEQILKAGNQAAALTSQLLAFSRRQMIQPKPVDLNHVVTNLEKMLRRVIGEDIVLHTLLSEDLDCVKADPNQMEQVLINLVANARDAMPHGGALTISTRNVTLEAPFGCEGNEIPPGGYVELAVSDTGEGMDEETRSHLFEPFFTTKERGKGTGLGLSSVYGSVRQNGGGIVVNSERGRGAEFLIYLPQIQEPASMAKNEPASNGIHRGCETILLVEDEAEVRNMLRESLAGAGYRVLEAKDGTDALRRWEREAPSIDLLLTDVVMPLLNGRELARRLTSIAEHIQVIYISGYADDVLAYHGTLAPGTVLIQKPFSPAELMMKVREVLDTRKQGPPSPHRPAYQQARI